MRTAPPIKLTTVQGVVSLTCSPSTHKAEYDFSFVEHSLFSNPPSICHQNPHGISHFLIAFGAEKQGKSRVKGS